MRTYPAILVATVVAIVAVADTLVPLQAEAHVPRLEPKSADAPVVIGGPEASRATYGYLAPDEDADEYTFTVGTQVTREIGVIVPAYEEHSEFRPTLTITPEDGPPIVIADPGEEPRTGEFEPFSLTRFWAGGEREVRFEPDTRYTLRVAAGEGAKSGRYVVVFAGPERFDGADVAATLRDLPVIWFAAYGGAPFRWNWLALIPLAVVASLLAALAFALRWLLRLRHQGRPQEGHAR